MGLKLRIASAKVLLAASVLTVLATAPAFAVALCPPIGNVQTPVLGANDVSMDTAFVVGAASNAASGYYFRANTGNPELSVSNAKPITASSGSGIYIIDNGGTFSSICYDGTAAATIAASDTGIRTTTDGEVRIRSLGEITASSGVNVLQLGPTTSVWIETATINASSVAIQTTTSGAGTVHVSAGNIQASTSGYGVSIEHYNQGDISLSTGNINAYYNAIYSTLTGDGTTTINTGDLSSLAANALMVTHRGDGDMSVHTGNVFSSQGTYYGVQLEKTGNGAITLEMSSVNSSVGGPLINRYQSLFNGSPFAGDGDISMVIHGDVTTIFGDGALILQTNATLNQDSNLSLRIDGVVNAALASVANGISITQVGAGAIEVAANVVNASLDAVHIEKTGNGRIGVITSGGVSSLYTTAIAVMRTGDGDVAVATGGNVSGASAGIDIDHTGDEGDISITTATGTILTALGGVGLTGAYSPPIDGPIGIYARRENATARSSISIINGADITAGLVGIYAELCGCSEGDITILSTGAITVEGVDYVDPTYPPMSIVGFGISALSDADGTVSIETRANITAPDFAIWASHNGDEGDLVIATAKGTTFRAQDGVAPTTSGPIAIYAGRDALHGNVSIDNGAEIFADYIGIAADLYGEGDLTVTAWDDITVAGIDDFNGDFTGTGITATNDGPGDIAISTYGNITAPDVGIDAEGYDPSGDITVWTAADKTINATGAGDNTPILGSVGIFASRMAPSTATGKISIVNNSDIEAGAVGIFAGDLSLFGGGGGCGCIPAGGVTIDIESSGDIETVGASMLSAGIVALTEGDANIRVTNGHILAPAGIFAFAANTSVFVGKTATIESSDASGVGIVASSYYNSSVTVAGTVKALNGATAIVLGGDVNTLTLETGSSITGDVLADPGATTSTLALGGNTGSDRFDLMRVADQFQMFYSFKKTGGSTWTLFDQTSTFDGNFVVEEGLLKIEGSIDRMGVTLAGGRIGGNGTIASLTATSGIIAPGNSIGTLTVGAATLAGIVYEVETNAAGVSDKLIVTGTADIAVTSTVLAQPEPGNYAKTTTYTILTAGTLTGPGFGSASSASPYFDVTLSTAANNVYLTFTRKALGTVAPGLTPNQKATAAGLDSFPGPAPYFANLMQLPTAQLPAALSALSGDGYASLITALITDQRYLRDATLDRLNKQRFSPEPIIATGFASDPDSAEPLAGKQIWGRAYGGFSATPGDGNGPAINHAGGGFIVGADADLGTMRAGVLGAAGVTAFTVPDRIMSGTSADYSIGAYGDAEWNEFYLSFGATITGHAIRTTRTAAFAGVNDVFTAQYAALSSQAFAEIGYNVAVTPATTVTPFAGLALVNTLTGGFTESGAGAGALTIAPSAVTGAIVTLGVRAEHQIAMADGVLATLSGSVAWRHAIGGTGQSTHNFQGGAPFTVTGAPLAADQLLVTLGADFDISDDVALGFAYSGAFGNGGSHALTGTLTGHF